MDRLNVNFSEARQRHNHSRRSVQKKLEDEQVDKIEEDAENDIKGEGDFLHVRGSL
ncbi:hypothetical protein [Sinorhizobium fredii]|uniref:hypothetical protein n=1 Tax=Rhizobium fredii TaxID=380 RepID=UPI00130D9D8A|nr:hypothetical protein [Sinorhizobium fredii]WOS61339.1 hypothetical protein SFGR64A_10210 [Sinorhizobium fredii GR64]